MYFLYLMRVASQAAQISIPYFAGLDGKYCLKGEAAPKWHQLLIIVILGFIIVILGFIIVILGL